VTAVGLCEHCRWVRLVATRRGSTFYRCGLAETDARYAKYPVLPVLSCPGYETGPAEEAGAGTGDAGEQDG
jgi:hypothetical protein